jgi:hypothetical protein
VQTAVVGVIGVLLGALIGHRLTLWRERASGRDSRKREFLAFMAQLIAETENHLPGGHGEFYKNKRPNLQYAATKVADDFLGEARVEFDRLMAIAAGFTKEEAANPHNCKGKKDLLEAFNAVAHFAKEKL